MKINYHKLYIGRCDKENVCEREEADFFIDDDLTITKKVANYLKGKTKSILISSDYNKNFQTPENVYRIDTLEELYGLVNINNDEKVK